MIYGDVFERLEAEGVRYVAVGGVAVVLHGHERPVKDLDIVVDPAPAEARRATAALMSLGFVPTPSSLHFMGRPLAGRLDTDPAVWRFTLGDTDFF